MIFDTHKIIVVAITKTGTTTIWRTLNDGSDPERNHWHGTVDELLERYGEERFNTYRKISVIRNPYDRLWSCWKHTRLKDQTIAEEGMVSRFRAFIKEELENETENPHFRQQYKQLLHEGQTRIEDSPVDHIIRYEDGLDVEWKKLVDEYGICPLIKQKWNVTVKIDEDPYDEETRKIVQDIYKMDFELLGYGK